VNDTLTDVLSHAKALHQNFPGRTEKYILKHGDTQPMLSDWKQNLNISVLVRFVFCHPCGIIIIILVITITFYTYYVRVFNSNMS
jgi:hypothetical protein